MNIIRKNLLKIIAVLCFVIVFLLYKVSCEKNVLQKNMDFIFTNSISDAAGGLSKDYDQMDSVQIIQCYDQTLYNLYDAQEVFYQTSYKKYDDLFYTLNRIYFYIMDHHSERYEIENQGRIYEFLTKVICYPEDDQLIDDFNRFLDSQTLKR